MNREPSKETLNRPAERLVDFAHRLDTAPDNKGNPFISYTQRFDGAQTVRITLEPITGNQKQIACITKDPRGNVKIKGDSDTLKLFAEIATKHFPESNNETFAQKMRRSNLPLPETLRIGAKFKHGVPAELYQTLKIISQKYPSGSNERAGIAQLKAELCPNLRLVELINLHVNGAPLEKIIKMSVLGAGAVALATFLSSCGVKTDQFDTPDTPKVPESEINLDRRIAPLVYNSEKMNPANYQVINDMLKQMEKYAVCKFPDEDGSIPIVFLDHADLVKFFPRSPDAAALAVSARYHGLEGHKEFVAYLRGKYKENGQDFDEIMKKNGNIGVIAYFLTDKLPFSVFVLPHELAHLYCKKTDQEEGKPLKHSEELYLKHTFVSDFPIRDLDGSITHQYSVIGMGESNSFGVFKLEPFDQSRFDQRYWRSGHIDGVEYMYPISPNTHAHIFTEFSASLINSRVLKDLGYNDISSSLLSAAQAPYEMGIRKFLTVVDSFDIPSPKNPNLLYSYDDLGDFAVSHPFTSEGFIESLVEAYKTTHPNTTPEEIESLRIGIGRELLQIYIDYMRQ